MICRIDERDRQLALGGVEATYGWYWAVETLQKARFEVHLAHPYGMKAMRKRVKTNAGMLMSWRTRCAWVRCPRVTSPRPRCGSYASWFATAAS